MPLIMATSLLPLLPGTLPQGICFASEQARLNAYAELLQAVLAGGLAFYNFGDTEPDVDNRSYPWLRTTDGRWYIYTQGVWATPRPVCEQDPFYRILWAGAEANVPTKDGGSAGPVSDITGPFWEIDTLAAGRSPMAPGTIPSSDPGKVLAVGEQYGAGSITLTEAQFAHRHAMKFASSDTGSTYPTVSNGDTFAFTFNTEAVGDPDNLDPVNIVAPVYGLWVLKPTARIYYTV